MARTDTRFRSAYNQTLDLLAPLAVDAALPSELKLAETLKVSRTVVRRVLQALAEFSRGGQVVVFTHHEHLLDVARRAVPSDVLQVAAL